MNADGSRAGTIGFIGLGNMGGPMASRLLQAGIELTIWGRDPQKLTCFEALGAKSVSSPADIAARCDIIVLSLTNEAAIRSVLFGADGVAEGKSQRGLVIDTSTISPDGTVAIARELNSYNGMRWLDSPVSGGVSGATAGTLAVMAGGNEADFRQANSVFRHIAARATLMGSLGAGQRTKIINQLIVGTTMAVLAEALALAERAGIDAAVLPNALKGGRADSCLLQQFWPKMSARDEKLNSPVVSLLKDFDIIEAFATSLGIETPLAHLAGERFRTLSNLGYGDCDVATIIRMFDTPIERDVRSSEIGKGS